MKEIQFYEEISYDGMIGRITPISRKKKDAKLLHNVLEKNFESEIKESKVILDYDVNAVVFLASIGNVKSIIDRLRTTLKGDWI